MIQAGSAMAVNKKRLAVIVLVVLAVGVNALYDGKIAEFIGNTIHTWQTGETVEHRRARGQYRTSMETRYQGWEACPALEDFAREVGDEAVDRRGIRAEVVLANVRADPDRDLVSAYLEAFEHLAYEESRGFDDELRRIVRDYCWRRKKIVRDPGQ